MDAAEKERIIDRIILDAQVPNTPFYRLAAEEAYDRKFAEIAREFGMRVTEDGSLEWVNG